MWADPQSQTNVLMARANAQLNKNNEKCAAHPTNRTASSGSYATHLRMLSIVLHRREGSQNKRSTLKSGHQAIIGHGQSTLLHGLRGLQDLQLTSTCFKDPRAGVAIVNSVRPVQASRRNRCACEPLVQSSVTSKSPPLKNVPTVRRLIASL